jgi:glucosyl-dolichyl phosphate glucuronosyltransferase
MNKNSIQITVAICTWNRAVLLDQTLESMRHQEIPDGVSWELLVVNNNCSDNTDEIIDKYKKELPLVRIFESRQGLSNARNTVVKHARGKYILWTDDDVLLDSRWIAAYLDAFERWPKAAVFGGKVLPLFEVLPPKWLGEHIDKVGRYYALRDFGDKEFVLRSGQNPYGANLAFRANILRQYSFNPDLGRKGDLLVSGEDAHVIRMIRKAGWSVVWIPSSIVQHFLPKHRMKLNYLKKLHYSNGLYEVGAMKNPTRCIFGYPLWLLRNWLFCEIGYRIDRIMRPKSYRWLDKMIKASSFAGQLAATRISLKKDF